MTWKTTVALIVWVAGLFALVLTIGHPWAHDVAVYFTGGANAVLAIRIWRWAFPRR